MRLWHHGNMKEETGRWWSSLFNVTCACVNHPRTARMGLRSRLLEMLYCWADGGDSWPALADERRGVLHPPATALSFFIISFFHFPGEQSSKSWGHLLAAYIRMLI
jgi:hypothetical protein